MSNALIRSAPVEAGRRFLRSPDAVWSIDRPTDPLALAVAGACGLAGADAFFAIALGSAYTGSPLVLLAPLFAGALCLPPLIVGATLLGHPQRLLSLAAVGLAGPIFAGVTLAAAAPIALLYRMTSEVDPGFYAVVALLCALALIAGGRAAWTNARRAGLGRPGGALVVGHYVLTLWTLGVLAVHLA